MKLKHIIFDLDDTLISCAKYYAECKQSFGEIAASRTGLQAKFCESILQKIDIECTHLPNGWGKERFPKSFAAASVALDIIAGNEVDDRAAEQAFLLGESVFTAPYELLPDTIKTLNELKSHGYDLYLLTKGDFEMQRYKIAIHGLDKIFSPDKIYIVPRKSGFELKKLVDDFTLDVDKCLVVGDSIRDDVDSANKVGIRSLHIVTGGTWGYETVKAKPTWTGESIAAIWNILPDLRREQFLTHFTNAYL